MEIRQDAKLASHMPGQPSPAHAPTRVKKSLALCQSVLIRIFQILSWTSVFPNFV